MKPKSTKRNKPWFTPELKVLLTNKRHTEAIWRKTQSPDTKTLFTQASRIYKQAILNTKAQIYNTRIDNASSNSKELFRILKELENPAPPDTGPPASDSWCTDIQNALTNKINLLKSKIIQKQRALASRTTTPHPTPQAHHDHPPFKFTPVTEKEMAHIIEHIKPTICKGDICPAPLVKDCALALVPLITRFINASFNANTVPTSIKEAWVTPLLKKPSLDPHTPTNYRPITTVPFLLKILDRVAYLQMQHYLETYHLLGSRQSGFRPAHSTETALLDLKLQLDKSMDAGNISILLLLDLSAAFDLVDHRTLCHHLETTANFSPEATTWVASFLKDRTSKVCIDTHTAKPTPVPCGVPQGSCISPTLYNIYTKPLFDLLDAHHTFYTNYADDTQILIPLTGDHPTDTLTINSTYQLIQSWMATHHLCLNDDKTELLLIGPKHRLARLSPDYTSFTIDGTPIPISENTKTLGVYIDSELNMTRQINAIASSSAYTTKLINHARPLLSTTNCLTLSRAIIGAKIDYCNVLLTGTSAKNTNKLQVVQNNALRAALGISRSAHISEARREAHWLPVKSRIKFKTLTMAHRCIHGNSPPYLSNCIAVKANPRTLRSNYDHCLQIPRINRTRAGGRSFAFTAPTLWNTMPLELRSEPSLTKFKKLLKTWLFNQEAI